MQQSLILLDQSTKASKEIEPRLIKDAQEKIKDAITQVEEIGECYNLMLKDKKQLE
ncbi:MAG: hypothetical protein ACP5NV_05340 [Candidatus Woesearchaeota archaeon]